MVELPARVPAAPAQAPKRYRARWSYTVGNIQGTDHHRAAAGSPKAARPWRKKWNTVITIVSSASSPRRYASRSTPSTATAPGEGASHGPVRQHLPLATILRASNGLARRRPAARGASSPNPEPPTAPSQGASDGREHLQLPPPTAADRGDKGGTASTLGPDLVGELEHPHRVAHGASAHPFGASMIPLVSDTERRHHRAHEQRFRLARTDDAAGCGAVDAANGDDERQCRGRMPMRQRPWPWPLQRHPWLDPGRH